MQLAEEKIYSAVMDFMDVDSIEAQSDSPARRSTSRSTGVSRRNSRSRLRVKYPGAASAPSKLPRRRYDLRSHLSKASSSK